MGGPFYMLASITLSSAGWIRIMLYVFCEYLWILRASEIHETFFTAVTLEDADDFICATAPAFSIAEVEK